MPNATVHPDHRIATTHFIDWKAAIWASIIAGVVFAGLEVVLVPLFQGNSPWAPLHMIGAIVLGPSAMAAPDALDLPVIGTAVVVHFVLAILYGVMLAWLVERLGSGMALLVGAAYGLALYHINFYGFTRWFPWFENARDWISITAHIVQSGLMAYLYKRLERHQTTY